MEEQNAAPIFSAVSNSAHQLYILLRCLGFASKAFVQITPDGIRFSVENGRVMQGLAFLDKALFTNYIFNPPPGTNNNDSEEDEGDDSSSDNVLYPRFLISLSALLETLQILGISDTPSSTNAPSATDQNNQPASHAFSARALHLDRSCTLGYTATGSPLTITLSEAGMTTTCELTTYEPEDVPDGSSSAELDIPLQRDAITLKIIMRSAWLHNAIQELTSTNPTILTVSASDSRSPFFALSASGGPFSESTVEFSVDSETPRNAGQDHHHKVLTEDGSSSSRSKRSKHAPAVAETFLVSPPPTRSIVKQSYRFSLIRNASRAMAAASKVSIRGDRQGVLSLQFMIELADGGSGGGRGDVVSPEGGNVSFVDFRFVPLLDEEGDESDGR